MAKAGLKFYFQFKSIIREDRVFIYKENRAYNKREKIVCEVGMKKGVVVLAVTVLLSGVGFFGGCKKEEKVASRYEMNVEFSPQTATVSGTVKLTFTNVYDQEIKALKFQLYPNAYRENAVYKAVSKTYEKAAYYEGESYGVPCR